MDSVIFNGRTCGLDSPRTCHCDLPILWVPLLCDLCSSKDVILYVRYTHSNDNTKRDVILAFSMKHCPVPVKGYQVAWCRVPELCNVNSR